MKRWTVLIVLVLLIFSSIILANQSLNPVKAFNTGNFFASPVIKY